MAKTCYFCGAPATTREHIPGRAFYPEQKDLPPGSPNVRENMLTVPACAEHNNAQSMDDQYAAYTIVTSLDNNALSRSHIAGKVLRAIKRTPHIFDTLMPEARPVLIDGQESVAFKMDRERMSSVMERFARGLYFHHTGKRLVIPLDWISPDMLNMEKGFHRGSQRMSAAFDNLDKGDPDGLCHEGHVGSPEVFTYEIMRSVREGDPRAYFRMTFYEGFRVLVFPQRAKDDDTAAGETQASEVE